MTMEKLTAIRPDEVHIHLLRVGEEPAFMPDDFLMTRLPSDERQRFLQIESEIERREYLWSRLLLRRLLSFYLDLGMENFQFSFGDKGKPFLENSRLKFNLSHTDGLIACAFGWSEMGIDVEKVDIQERCGWKHLTERYFSPDENAFLFSQPCESQALTFFRIFTMKEAYVKATGRGLSLPLNTFSVPLLPSQRSRLGRWEFSTNIFNSNDYCRSHVLDNPENTPYRRRFHDWDGESLVTALKNGNSARFEDVVLK